MIHLSLVTTILSVVSSFLFKYLDKMAAGESFVFQFYEGMTAYINWLPHLGKLQQEQGFHLNYGVIKSSLHIVTRLFGITHSIDF